MSDLYRLEWSNDESRASLIPLILRMSPEIASKDFGGENADVSELVGAVQQWTDSQDALQSSTNERWFRDIAGQGIFIVDPDAAPIIPGLTFNKDDLIVRVNGKHVSTFSDASALLSDRIMTYSEDPSKETTLSFQIVNSVKSRLVFLDLAGEIEHEVVKSRKGWLGLTSLALVVTRNNKKGTEEAGRSIVDINLILSPGLAGPLDLEASDRIVQVAGERIRGFDDLISGLEAARELLQDESVDSVPMLVFRPRMNQYIRVTLRIEDEGVESD